jgi:hypothetical protein
MAQKTYKMCLVEVSVSWNVVGIVFMSVPRLQREVARLLKNRLKCDLKSNQIICPKSDLKLQLNCHFPKRFKIKIKSNCFTQWPIIFAFLVRLSTCIIILKILKGFSKNKIDFYVILLVFLLFIKCFVAF